MSKKNAMGYIFPQVIRSVLRGETPKVSISTYVEDKIKEQQDLKEGEVFTDEYNYEWIVKRHPESGKLYKERQSKLQGAKMPWWCPECGVIMNKRWDEKMYWSQGMCFDCVVKRDTEMKIAGTFEDYEKKVITSKVTGFLNDAKKEIESYLENLSDKQTFVNEDGELEEWSGDTTQVREFLEKELIEIDKSLKKYESEENYDGVHREDRG